MSYLLDANVFIEAKNSYYGFDLCPGFWEWLDLAHQHQLVSSVQPIFEELAGKGDDLSNWANERFESGFFLSTESQKTQKLFEKIVSHILQGDYKSTAIQHFLSRGDGWLIAKAIETGATVVTHEAFEPRSKRAVKIPNICRYFDVTEQPPAKAGGFEDTD